MAKKGGNPQNLRPPFSKGVSGNPSGRPKNRLTLLKLRQIIDELMFMNRTKLQAVVTNQDATVVELILASVMVQAIKTGDYSRLSAILDRAIGRASNDDNTDSGPSQQISDDERKALKKLTANG